jgi:hypothetical protein
VAATTAGLEEKSFTTHLRPLNRQQNSLALPHRPSDNAWQGIVSFSDLENSLVAIYP